MKQITIKGIFEITISEKQLANFYNMGDTIKERDLCEVGENFLGMNLDNHMDDGHSLMSLLTITAVKK